MTSDNLLKWVGLVTGLVTAGEAAALLIGMVALSPRPNPWLTWLNLAWAALDLVGGAGVVWGCLALRGLAPGRWLPGLIGVLVVTHLYRAWEYFARSGGSHYLVNAPLAWVNLVKLAGLIVLFYLVLESRK